jgi:hypothetical protein
MRDRRCYRIVRWREPSRRGWVVVVDPWDSAETWDVLGFFDTYFAANEYLLDVSWRQRVLEGKE